MTSLIDAIYDSACKIMIPEILNGDGEYLVRERCFDLELEQLYADLSQAEAARVDDLLAERIMMDQLREEASFRAGFRLALELTR